MFKGSFNSQIQENHVFLSNDPIMENIGLSSFSSASFKEIIANNLDGIKLVYPKLGEYLDTIISKDEALIDLVSNGTYRKFNVSNKTYESVEIPISDVKDLIDYHEQICKTPSDKLESIKNNTKDIQILDIQNSLTRSILFQLPKKYFGWPDNDDSVIRFNLFFTKSNQSNNRRIMAQKGPPMIVSVPRRSTGGTHGFRQTQLEQETSIGSYSNPSNDGIEDINNTVGAPLKITYNQNTKMWESGTTQILAKLTEDVPAAEIKNVQISQNDIETVTGSEQFYSADSQYYMGGHVTTLAIPLSLENGNPHLFGPNILKCKDGKCETLRAVNRAPRSFSAGSVVLLSNIDGEWIIQDFGANPEDLKPSKVSFGEWSFTKLIADSDSYFKDARFYSGVNEQEKLANPTLESKVFSSITPYIYEYQSRLKFVDSASKNMIAPYQYIYGDKSNIIGRISALNLELDDPSKIPLFISKELFFIPSTRYYVATIFDQIAKDNGGFSNKTYISKTNVTASDLSSFNGYPGATEVPLFWGPVFSAGYKNLKLQVTPYNQLNQDKYFVTQFQMQNPQDPEKTNFSSIFLPENFSKEHFPAEMSTLILDTLPIIENWNLLGVQTISANYIRPPFYASSPNSIETVQFSPLYADLAAHDDIVSKVAKYPVRNYYDFVRQRVEIDSKDINLWGKMYDRNKYHGPVFFEKVDGLFNLLKRCNAYDINNDQSLLAWRNYKFLAYDCWITKKPTNLPVGAPEPFLDSDFDYKGANLVGVIAAKQTITKPRGGKINFTVGQNFGLPQKKTLSGSPGSLSILPIGGIGAVVGNDPPSINRNAFPQWGSSILDRYDSFGTTALHVRIFDYWPPENTIYDPRYFGVLHFNPGILYSMPSVTTLGLINDKDIQEKYGSEYSLANLPPNISYSDIKRDVDQGLSSMDLRVPTYGIKFSENTKPDTTLDNTIIKENEIINSDTWPLRPNNEWRINTIRRGQILTNGGFNYLHHAIGLSSDYKIVNSGEGFESGTKLKLAGLKEVEIELSTQDTKISAISFISTNNLDSNNGRGWNFIPSDFGSISSVPGESRKCYKLNIPAPTNGKSAVIEFYSGIVYLRHGLDKEPVEHVEPKRISSSSKSGLGDGKGMVYQALTSDANVNENNTGKYDCFYFFHNDVTHTPMEAFPFTPGLAQYITLSIS